MERIISCTDSDIAIDGVSLLNLGKVDVVDGSCSLVCSQENVTSSPVIGINFDLTLADTNQASLPEGNVNVSFSTSIKMRNN